MQSALSHYTMLAKRWAWLIVLGIVICGSTTYIVSKFIHPVYRASATVFINFGSATSAYDNTTASLEAVQTYSQLLASPEILKPVVAQNRGLTLQQLDAMVTVQPQPNTQLIELDVENHNPVLAMQLANEICQSFAEYAGAQLPISVQILPAELPSAPIKPQPLVYAGIGALVGLGLALALIVIFEWIDDRLASPEQLRELLSMETLTIIPQVSHKRKIKRVEVTPALAEGCRMLCASLNAARAAIPFKLVMVTSALAGEGKSTIAANVAVLLAATGKRVLLVDADLRHPVLDQYFHLDNRQGLSNILLETHPQSDVHLDGYATSIPGLQVLTAGTLSSNPADLLQAPLTNHIFDRFNSLPCDYVIFDTPPLLPVADTQILASYIKATVLVVDVSTTPRKALLGAKRLLSRTHTLLLGAALNKSNWPDYGDIHQYQSYERRSKVDAIMAILPDTPSTDLPDLDTPSTDLPAPGTPSTDLPDLDTRVIAVADDSADPDVTVTLPSPRMRKIVTKTEGEDL